MMRNRYILFGIDLGGLSSVLCGLLQDSSFAETVATDNPIIKHEFIARGYTILKLLAGYQSDLSTEQQSEIFATLVSGLSSGYSTIQGICISALTLCYVQFPSSVSASFVANIIEGPLSKVICAYLLNFICFRYAAMEYWLYMHLNS
jgi:hypothetical protein